MKFKNNNFSFLFCILILSFTSVASSVNEKPPLPPPLTDEESRSIYLPAEKIVVTRERTVEIGASAFQIEQKYIINLDSLKGVFYEKYIALGGQDSIVYDKSLKKVLIFDDEVREFFLNENKIDQKILKIFQSGAEEKRKEKVKSSLGYDMIIFEYSSYDHNKYESVEFHLLDESGLEVYDYVNSLFEESEKAAVTKRIEENTRFFQGDAVPALDCTVEDLHVDGYRFQGKRVSVVCKLFVSLLRTPGVYDIRLQRLDDDSKGENVPDVIVRGDWSPYSKEKSWVNNVGNIVVVTGVYDFDPNRGKGELRNVTHLELLESREALEQSRND